MLNFSKAWHQHRSSDWHAFAMKLGACNFISSSVTCGLNLAFNRNRGTVDSLSVPISPNEVPVPQPVHRAFRSTSGTGETVWYPSSGPSDIQCPPQIPSTTGYLWVHRNTQTNRITMWMYGKDRVWEPAAPGKAHPFVEDRILKLRQSSGEPSWVTRSSDQTVRGREVKDKRKGVSLPPS